MGFLWEMIGLRADGLSVTCADVGLTVFGNLSYCCLINAFTFQSCSYGPSVERHRLIQPDLSILFLSSSQVLAR